MQMFQSHKFTPLMQQQLNDSLALLKLILGPNLLGVYLYGSSVAGGLQKYSDIDLFVVTTRMTTLDEKKRLVTNLWHLHKKLEIPYRNDHCRESGY